jgi:hypothetical protein
MARFRQDGRAQMAGKGFRADRVTGDMVQTQTASMVMGRIINDGVVTTCTTCGGERGWRTTNGVLVHLACGAIQ